MYPSSTPLCTTPSVTRREPQILRQLPAALLRCVSSVACLALAWLAMAVPAAMGQSTRYAFSNFAGLVGGPGSVDGTGSAARFNYPDGAAVDGAGNVYVADTGNHTIRKVTLAGVVTTFAGNAGNIGSTDAPAGPATAARFNNPQGVAVDAAGNVYVADTGNHTIRKITPGGVVSTVAGLANFSGSFDGTGSAARFYLPAGIAIDAAGANVYVGDTRNSTIRKIVTATGVVSTIAGAASNIGFRDAPVGPGSVARFDTPEGVAVDGAGNVYVADSGNHTIRKIVLATGVVSTYAGSAGTIGSADAPFGPATAATFDSPLGVAVDAAGNVYVADTANHTIRKITPVGVVSTLAAVAGVSGAADGTGVAAEFYRPAGLSVDAAGANVYVADTFNLTVRKVTAAGAVTTLAGMSEGTGIADGSGTAARFNNPLGVATDTAGNSYVADTGSHTIRMITPAGLVSTLAGNAGVLGSADGAGLAAEFYNPSSVAVDAAFNVYVADTGNHTIRMITPGGVVTTLAGTAGISGSTDATGANARFNSPRGVAVGSGLNPNVYVADTGNHTIRRITPAGAVTTFIGTAGNAGSRDGVGTGGTANGAMTNATGFAFGSRTIATSSTDGTGTILAGDIVTFGSDPSGYLVTTGTTNLKGRGTANGAGTGGGAVAVGSTVIPTSAIGAGSILVGDVISFPGDPNKYLVSVGTPDVTGGGAGSFIILSDPLLVAIPASVVPILIDGSSITIASPGLFTAIPASKTSITVVSTAQFSGPKGVALDVAGNLYVADTGNNTIRKVTPARAVTTLAGSAGTSGTNDGVLSSARFKNPGGVAVDAIGNMYVADTGNYTIRKITSLGVVSTIGGTPGILGSANGAGLAARFYNPSSVALDAAGNIFVADTRNNRISRGVPFLAFGTKIKRDFNSDGADDLIFQNALGQVAVWYLNGSGAISSAGWISTGALGDWVVVGLADMNGDGNADLVFQNTPGQIAVWYMNGAGAVTSVALISAGALGDWRIVGITDMNNDGNADLIFQNTAGQIVVWYMNGGGGVLTFSYLSAGGLGDWRIVGVGDLNGDSNADIVFQNTLGQIVVWYLNGAGAISSAAYLSAGAMGDWRVSGIGDLNGDGNADLLFKNTAGQIVVWYLNGAGVVSSAAYISVGNMPGWRLR